MIHNPVPWVGGKQQNAKHILALFPHPTTYTRYVEPFGGAASVLLHKERHGHYEVYNDLDNGLVNFWMQCRDTPDALQRKLETLPYSYALYREFYEDVRKDDPLEYAARWFYLLRSNFKARVGEKPDGWKSMHRRVGYSQADAYVSAVKMLEQVAQRFQGVEIDNRPFQQVITRLDSPQTLFYCDPPYIGAEHYYTAQVDHEELATLLRGVQGKVVLSYYDHPLLATWYAGWDKTIYQKKKTMDISASQYSTGVEVILRNFTTEGGLWA